MQFVRGCACDGAKYAKISGYDLFVFCVKGIRKFDLLTLQLIGQAKYELQVDDVSFGKKTFLVAGEHRLIEYSIETLEVVKRWLFQERVLCAEYAYGD